MDNLETMDKFLERFSVPRLNQEEIKKMCTDKSQALKWKLSLKNSQKTKVQDLHRRIL